MRFSWDRAINRNQGWRPTTVFERWLVLGLGSFNITPLETEQHLEFCLGPSRFFARARPPRRRRGRLRRVPLTLTISLTVWRFTGRAARLSPNKGPAAALPLLFCAGRPIPIPNAAQGPEVD